MIVADASLVANLLVPVLDQALAEAVLEWDRDWCAPKLWRYEFRNTLVKYIKAKLLTLDAANELLTHAMNAMKTDERDAPSDEVVEHAVRLKISSYDAEYVVYAKQLGVPLVTFDQKLIQAARGIAVSAAGFVG